MWSVRQGISRMLIASVRVYQAALRPWLFGSCRYVPSCSEYFIQALTEHGPGRGAWMGLRRIARCRPGGGWGYDPVPPGRRTAEGASVKD